MALTLSDLFKTKFSRRKTDKILKVGKYASPDSPFLNMGGNHADKHAYWGSDPLLSSYLPAHSNRHAAGGDDPVTPYAIGAVNKSGDTLTGKLKLLMDSTPYVVPIAPGVVMPGENNQGNGTVACAQGTRSGVWVIRITNGGDTGEATFAWSRDGGEEYNNNDPTGANVELKSGSYGTGLFVQFSGTFATGDIFTIGTTLQVNVGNYQCFTVKAPLITSPNDYDDIAIYVNPIGDTFAMCMLDRYEANRPRTGSPILRGKYIEANNKIVVKIGNMNYADALDGDLYMSCIVV